MSRTTGPWERTQRTTASCCGGPRRDCRCESCATLSRHWTGRPAWSPSCPNVTRGRSPACWTSVAHPTSRPENSADSSQPDPMEKPTDATRRHVTMPRSATPSPSCRPCQQRQATSRSRTSWSWSATTLPTSRCVRRMSTSAGCSKRPLAKVRSRRSSLRTTYCRTPGHDRRLSTIRPSGSTVLPHDLAFPACAAMRAWTRCAAACASGCPGWTTRPRSSMGHSRS